MESNRFLTVILRIQKPDSSSFTKTANSKGILYLHTVTDVTQNTHNKVNDQNVNFYGFSFNID